MKLFLIHVGYYEPSIMEGLYEHHINFFVAGSTINDAKQKAKKNSLFKIKKMHIDGIQQVDNVDGFRVELISEESNNENMTYDYDEVKKIK